MAPSASEPGSTWDSQWMSHMKAMQDAIAELKLPQTNGQSLTYGHDIVVSEDESLGVDIGNDIWDFLSSDDEDSSSSDRADSVEYDSYPNLASVEPHDADWLGMRCARVARGKSGLDPGDLEEQISAVLASDMEGELVTSYTEPSRRQFR